MVSTTPSLPKIAEAAWFLDAALTTYIKIWVNCRSAVNRVTHLADENLQLTLISIVLSTCLGSK